MVIGQNPLAIALSDIVQENAEDIKWFFTTMPAKVYLHYLYILYIMLIAFQVKGYYSIFVELLFPPSLYTPRAESNIATVILRYHIRIDVMDSLVNVSDLALSCALH